MKKSDVAFTPLQNSDHSGSVQGLAPGSQPDSGTGEADFVNGESRCCGSNSTCLRLGREQQKYTVWDCLWILAAVTVYFADVGTDVWLSVDYYLRRDYWWFELKCLLKQQRQPGVCLLPCTPLFSSPPPSAPTPRPIPLFCLINPRTRPSSSAVWKLPALPSRIYDCSSQFGLIKLEQAFKRFI